MPPPCPPSVKAGRTISGRPISSIARSASAIEVTIAERGTRRPAAVIVSRNSSRSSARLDRVVVDADQLDAEALERAVLVERLREVERRLAAERAEQRVGALALDHGRHASRA